MDTFTAKIRKLYLDMLLESFMDDATRWAKSPRGGDGYTQGVDWGHAFGICNTLDFLGLVDKETAAELKAVLLSKNTRKELIP